MGPPGHIQRQSLYSDGSSKTELNKHPEKARAIWTRKTDWSAMLREGATLNDIDSEALQKAREQFIIKHPSQAAEVETWDDATFLNKAKLTIHNKITNSALLLLGKPESSALLSPAVIKVSWILKDDRNRELDYEHFGPPIILQVDRILGRIRNLTIRTLPSGTLFPQEITQYDPWVIREALHNAIAHQDYGLGGRINIVETPSSVLIGNVGGFLPGDVENVIRQDAPLEIYRNPFLAESMVNLNMIDTQGGGIKRMFEKQKQRFFPMPDYDLSNMDRVQVSIPGNILDENYSRLLMERSDLDLWQVILLDHVQKRVRINAEAHRALKAAGLVEGRYPNLIIAANIARLTGQKAKYIRDRGFNKKYYLDMIETLIREQQPVPRSEIDRLLLDKLPEVLNTQQKKAKIHNLMTELARTNRIENRGSKGSPAWYAKHRPAINNE
jgi:ATP-dependent DNA helicase RecG